MAFNMKAWLDRLSEFPNRRKLDSTGVTDTYDVTRAEGTVSVEGDKLDAATMNDLEQRIADGFNDTATAAQGDAADSAVQSATIGGTAVTKAGTQLQLPAYPTALKTPNALTFTGGVTGSFDGSAAKTVAIPTTLPANGGTALNAGYSSHAASSGTAGLKNNTAASSLPSGGQDGDGWDYTGS